jgi:hypothetical protein
MLDRRGSDDLRGGERMTSRPPRGAHTSGAAAGTRKRIGGELKSARAGITAGGGSRCGPPAAGVTAATSMRRRALQRLLRLQGKQRLGLTKQQIKTMGVSMKSEYLKMRAEEMRQIRLNQPRVSREAALKLFEQHRQAARSSRLSLKVSSSGGQREGLVTEQAPGGADGRGSS